MACLNLLLVESKVADDEQDGERLKAGFARGLYGQRFAKARAHLQTIGFPCQVLLALPLDQSRAERQAAPSLTDLCRPTAGALGEIFASIATHHRQPELEPKLRLFGAALGSYLYLWDALQDLSEDTKRGRFNAISAACSGYSQEAHTALAGYLEELDHLLESLALGPEGKLCRQLTATLRQRFEKELHACGVAARGPRHHLRQAGFVHKSGCCDCELDCCDCGCCDCNICNCDPCGTDRNQCCELNMCDLTSCCCLSCGDNRRSSWGNDGCCHCGGDSVTYEFGDTRAPQEPSRPGFLERWGMKKSTTPLAAEISSRCCPACDVGMVGLSVGSTELEECRNCGGFWLDDKEIDALAKLNDLPHNLLNRYPTKERPFSHLPGQRSCPVCDKSPLVGVPYLDIPVEMCRSCHGFWLEHGVLKRVIAAKRSPDRLSHAHQQQWRCPYCEGLAKGGSDTCLGCGAPRPKSGFTGKLA